MTRTRMDVRNLVSAEGDWPQVLVAYERAVGLLRQLDPPNGAPSNPLGWRFLAAMHGLARPDGQPDSSNPLWSNCQHGSWFFLPWHRMYLYAFEAIVQHALQDDSWSLPYWYSLEPGHAERFVLPAAFRDTNRADNNLLTPSRSVGANSGTIISEDDLTPFVTEALNARDFTSSDGSASFGSGERSSPSFNGEEVGLLEDTPHGGVHVFVGNDYDSQGRLLRRGWMGSFYTAALDPIFWLHHANMDRLWQVWLEADPAHRNPSGDPAWANTKFSFPAPGGGLATWKIGDVLDTVALGVNESVQDRQRAFDLFQAGNEPGWRNRLIWGDKKYVLPALSQELAGKVDLIYIDPPFATGADFSFAASVPGSDATFTKPPSVIEQKAYRDIWCRGLDSYLQWFYDCAV